MIPNDYITEWREQAPWTTDYQVEQDLVISRALVDLFTDDTIAAALAFRGGTALYKLHFVPPARYSEDIDLVQTRPQAIGPVLDAVRDRLGPWLGRPRWKQTEGRVTLVYPFRSEGLPAVGLKLKIEINSREHFSAFGLRKHPFAVRSRWFSGAADITTFELDELLATKLRALYERRKGRDLFDLALALRRPEVSADRILDAFARYTGARVTRRLFAANLSQKRTHPQFTADLTPLLRTGYHWDLDEAFDLIWRKLVARLPDGA